MKEFVVASYFEHDEKIEIEKYKAENKTQAIIKAMQDRELDKPPYDDYDFIVGSLRCEYNFYINCIEI